MNATAIATFRNDRIEDLTWLAETGECLTGAARRLGLTVPALEQWARRHANDAYLRLRAREPHDPNQRPGMRAMRTRRAG